MNKIIIFFASGCYTGYSPFAPGTVGTLVGVVLAYFLCALSLPIYILTVTAFTFASFWFAQKAGEYYKETDSGKIVIDEIAGYLVAMIGFSPEWRYLLASFILFRFFDIIKLWPASYFDKNIKNGYGVVLDDIVAGLYSFIILYFLVYFKIL